MGYLLKEALKSICGLNQWAYAVFWKIGCQNPNLLIWEDCYYETAADSVHLRVSGNGNERPEVQGNKVSSLINMMMIRSQVNILGEGIVGRAAFTGQHQWILSEHYLRDAHPPEVLNEARHQYSAGMQCIAVIPVLSHGVVQLGSFLPIVENLGFVADVKSLISQLACIPGALFSDNYTQDEYFPSIDVPTSLGASDFILLCESSNSKERQGQICPQTNDLRTKNHNPTQTSANTMRPNVSFKSQLENGFTGAIVIPQNLDRRMEEHASSFDSCYVSNLKDLVNNDCVTSQPIMNEVSNYNAYGTPFGNCESNNIRSSYPGQNSIPISIPKPNKAANMFSGGFLQSHYSNANQIQNKDDPKKPRSEKDLFQALHNQLTLPDEHIPETEIIPSYINDFSEQKSGNWINPFFEESCEQNPLSDDLFDIFGSDFKNTLFSGSQNGSLYGSHIDKHNMVKGFSKSIDQHSLDNYSNIDSDHLLEAVVSKVYLPSKQNLSDDVSCRTTLTKSTTCTLPTTSSTFNGSGSIRSSCSKEDAGNCSQTSSIYGSQISSWIEQGNNAKRDTSVSTTYSCKKPEEMNKSNRKRLKPGENPRPRPKDRQMIQDRVKELREIVPNGAKCSIDALLERTIKHMLFLQSVTKHADKLKQTGESKIISKEGGATWAFEVGSQSMVCPIIVEDLNLPRQMLVEMLCEERGFFLEIADIIRGLGLTILNGVIEARNEKIWARFVVEANRDVTRMEIFISLVGLLEQTVKSSAAPALANCIDNIDTTAHHSFRQPTCIPTADGPGNLQ